MHFKILRTRNSQQSMATCKQNWHFSLRNDFSIPFLQQLSRTILHEVLEVNQLCKDQKEIELRQEDTFYYETNFVFTLRLKATRFILKPNTISRLLTHGPVKSFPALASGYTFPALAGGYIREIRAEDVARLNISSVCHNLRVFQRYFVPTKVARSIT